MLDLKLHVDFVLVRSEENSKAAAILERTAKGETARVAKDVSVQEPQFDLAASCDVFFGHKGWPENHPDIPSVLVLRHSETFALRAEPLAKCWFEKTALPLAFWMKIQQRPLKNACRSARRVPEGFASSFENKGKVCFARRWLRR